jgi:hypothetical protein
MTMLQLLLEAVSEYYNRKGEEPSINIRWVKDKKKITAKLFVDVDEDDNSMIAQAEGKSDVEAVYELAKVWAKMKFETGSISKFLQKIGEVSDAAKKEVGLSVPTARSS